MKWESSTSSSAKYVALEEGTGGRGGGVRRNSISNVSKVTHLANIITSISRNSPSCSSSSALSLRATPKATILLLCLDSFRILITRTNLGGYDTLRENGEHWYRTLNLEIARAHKSLWFELVISYATLYSLIHFLIYYTLKKRDWPVLHVVNTWWTRGEHVVNTW